jgi:hypothetical protein
MTAHRQRSSSRRRVNRRLSMLVGGIALLAVCWFPFGACSPDGDDT